MAVLEVSGGGLAVLSGGRVVAPNAVNLSDAQTGDGASTNVIDRGGWTGPALIKITTTIGGAPTVTVAIQGSADGTNWFNVPYADSATPATLSVATFVITTATTVYKLIQPGVPIRFLRLNYTGNTTVVSTADCWVF